MVIVPLYHKQNIYRVPSRNLLQCDGWWFAELPTSEEFIFCYIPKGISIGSPFGGRY